MAGNLSVGGFSFLPNFNYSVKTEEKEKKEHKTWEEFYNKFKLNQTEAELDEQIKKLERTRKEEAKKLGLPENASWGEIKKIGVKNLKEEGDKPVKKEQPKWA